MRRLRIFLLLAVASACAPCARSPTAAPFELRIALWGELDAISPITTGAGRNGAAVAQNLIFEPLTRFDERGRLIPALASRVERRGGRSVYVELRPGATFSDSSPVTVEDVQRSLATQHLTLRPEGQGYLVEAPAGGVPAEALLGQSLIFREHSGAFLGSGPFIVTATSPQSIQLTRREAAPRRVNRLELVAYPTPQEAFAHTLKGDTNLIVEVEPRWLEFFEGVPRLQVVRGRGTHNESVVFSSRLSRAERRSLAAALDSDEIRKLAFGDECGPARIQAPARDLAPQGRKLDLVAWPPAERFALAVRRRLQDSGGELKTLPTAQVLERLRAGEFDLAAVRVLIWPASSAALLWRTGSPYNFLGYSNPAVDAALDGADWPKAEQALADDPPIAFVCTRERIAVVDARVKNARVGPYDILDSLPEWEVSP